jgi:hypothetical protein
LLKNVLYDGTHCGDIISLERVRILKSEISSLRNVCFVLSSELSLLADKLVALIAAAEDNHNPIVFA